MKSHTIRALLVILILALSLATLPFVGLPYSPLRAIELRLALYDPPPWQIYLPQITR